MSAAGEKIWSDALAHQLAKLPAPPRQPEPLDTYCPHCGGSEVGLHKDALLAGPVSRDGAKHECLCGCVFRVWYPVPVRVEILDDGSEFRWSKKFDGGRDA